MSGDLARTRTLAPGLVPSDDGERYMAARIDAILARADRVAGVTSLDDRDLRGWHYVLTGGLLLHRSPHGFDDGMRGRYAWLQDSVEHVRTGLERLRDALVAWEIAPPCVYAVPGRDHEILAEAAARLLGVPRVPWPAIGVPAPGLVCAYDLADVAWKEVERLAERRPGQVFYVHASRWTEDGPITPDVTMLLHQSIVAPWGARIVITPYAAASADAPDVRSIDAIASDIVGAALLDGEEIAADDLDGLARVVGAVGPPPVGRRERLWAGSPVLSNRFL